MKWLIKTVRNPIYNGATEGVLFRNGEAIVTDEHIKNLLVNDYGYEATEINDEKEKEVKEKNAPKSVKSK